MNPLDDDAHRVGGGLGPTPTCTSNPDGPLDEGEGVLDVDGTRTLEPSGWRDVR